jgi:hypothetical protein
MKYLGLTILLFIFTSEVSAQRLDASKLTLKVKVASCGFAFLGKAYSYELEYNDNGQKRILPVNKCYVNGVENGNELYGTIDKLKYYAPSELPGERFEPIKIGVETIDETGQKIIAFENIYLMTYVFTLNHRSLNINKVQFSYEYIIQNTTEVKIILKDDGSVLTTSPQNENGTQSIVFTNLMQGCEYKYTTVKEPEPTMAYVDLSVKQINGKIYLQNVKFSYFPGGEIGLSLICPYYEGAVSSSEPYKPEGKEDYPVKFSLPLNDWEEFGSYIYFYKDDGGNTEHQSEITLKFKN